MAVRRYCRAAIYFNGKVKPHVAVVGGREEAHQEGSYCIRHKNSWIDAGTDPLEAQRMRSKLLDQAEYTTVEPLAATKGTPLAQASEKYFANLEARGVGAKSIHTYRTSVDPFVQTCEKACVEDVTKQDMIMDTNTTGDFDEPAFRSLGNDARLGQNPQE